ncbi:MAG: helix-turn-helix domain-containing protein [Rhodobiaceae bacterium]|nr:helix-turn-helix domain-containing protein [Rhodobiaceae bacterium]
MRDWPDFSRHQLPPDVQAHIDWLEARVMELEAGLVAEFEGMLRIAYGLTPTQARFLGALSQRDVLTRQMAMALLYGGEADPPNDKILDVLLCKIRRAIEPDFRIDVLWGTGWQMPADMRKRFTDRFMAPASEVYAA